MKSPSRSASCTFSDSGDPIWTGYREAIGNPLINVLEEDSIYAPSVVPSALMRAWAKWSQQAASEDEVKDGLTELFSWISDTARATPKGNLWQGEF